MSELIKKLILVFGAVVVFIFLAFLGAAMYMGAFASVDISSEVRGPYYFVYQDHIGLYQRIAEKIEEVHTLLEDRQVATIHPAAQYLDDPNVVPVADLRSRGGWLVKDSVHVAPPFHLAHIGQRSVALARIRAHPAVAPFKTYPALHDWLNRKKTKQDSSFHILEIYYDSGVVEVEMPIIADIQN